MCAAMQVAIIMATHMHVCPVLHMCGLRSLKFCRCAVLYGAHTGCAHVPNKFENYWRWSMECLQCTQVAAQCTQTTGTQKRTQPKRVLDLRWQIQKMYVALCILFVLLFRKVDGMGACVGSHRKVMCCTVLLPPFLIFALCSPESACRSLAHRTHPLIQFRFPFVPYRIWAVHGDEDRDARWAPAASVAVAKCRLP